MDGFDSETYVITGPLRNFSIRYQTIFVDGIGTISYPEKRRSNIQLKLDNLSKYVSHLPTRITQEMYIMADLSSDIPNDAADLSPLYMGNEEILCKITIDSNGLLRCKPDFTRGLLLQNHHDLTKGPVSIWPTLYFEVQSLDFWTRSRTEGYGFTELPRIAGAHSIIVSCWRPVGDSVVEELRRFFIGGTCQLEDPTFAKIPGSFEMDNALKTEKSCLHLILPVKL
ncbi:unnamed protein product [Schistosoma mattheei]|uniref:Uncharacterized protein n=1 Tax=Schistosoma mattheei TaxID=31246 RepID=A0A183PTY3_9TREM|nr:unnamed protein product [Schistosoma mattheei]